jgi:HSP20 family protein
MNTLGKLVKRGEGPVMVPWNRLFDEMLDTRLSADFPGFGTGWIPAVDVEETADEYLIRAEMPGLKKEDVKISLQENVLTISGEKKSEAKSDDKRYHRLERTYGSFQRSFSLPEPIKADKIGARFKDGVLEVKIPKSEETKPREIDIKVD